VVFEPGAAHISRTISFSVGARISAGNWEAASWRWYSPSRYSGVAPSEKLLSA
jgi:hypothetical protein